MNIHNFILDNNVANKKNLIDPLIIYGVPKKRNESEIKNKNIQNFNMIDSLKKRKVNYPMFYFHNIENWNLNIANANINTNIITNINTNINNTTQIENQNGNEAEMDESTLLIKKTISFQNQIIKEDKTEIKNEIIEESKNDNIDFLNKKRKANNKNENKSQFISDCLVKKIRIIILNSIINFINEKIKILLNNNIGKGIFIKQLLPINKTILYHSSVEYDKEFLNKKLKEILSSISNKYTNYLSNKNEELIEYLINLEDKGKYFQELFDLSFLDCLKYIRGTKNSELLNDLPNVDNILIQNENNINEDELNIYRYILNNYESIIDIKKTRNKKKAKNSKNIHFMIN